MEVSIVDALTHHGYFLMWHNLPLFSYEATIKMLNEREASGIGVGDKLYAVIVLFTN